jgi:hypothetical protein
MNVQMNATGLDTVPYLSGERTAILQIETMTWEILNTKQER